VSDTGLYPKVPAANRRAFDGTEIAKADWKRVSGEQTPLVTMGAWLREETPDFAHSQR